MANLYAKIDEKTFDNLVNSIYPPPEVFHIDMEADNGVVKRGAVLARIAASEKYILLGGTAADISGNVVLTEGVGTLENAWLDSSDIEVYTDATKETLCAVTTDYTVTYTDGVLTITAVAEGELDAASGCYVEIGVNAAGTIANVVLAEDIDTDEETVAQAYRTGHFNRNKIITATGYTFTAEDEEALRSMGILLSDALN